MSKRGGGGKGGEGERAMGRATGLWGNSRAAKSGGQFAAGQADARLAQVKRGLGFHSSCRSVWLAVRG